MILDDLGFQSTDVLELLFFCVTDHEMDGQHFYIFFKTKNPEVIKVAMNGD